MAFDPLHFRFTQAAIGSPEDDAATTTTERGSQIAFLKAIFGKLGGGTAATLVSDKAQGSTTAGQGGVLVQAAVTTAAPTYITGQTNPLSLKTTGNLRVNDDAAATLLTAVDAKLATLNFSTDTLESALGIVTETAPATDTASAGLNGRLQRIAQRLTSLIALVPASLGQKTMAQSFAVTLASDDPLSVMQQASTASITALASAATSAQLLASNAARKGLILNNTDANAVLVKYGTTASATSFTVRIPLNGYWEMPKPIYTGRIDAIWEADGAGSLYATEL